MSKMDPIKSRLSPRAVRSRPRVITVAIWVLFAVLLGSVAAFAQKPVVTQTSHASASAANLTATTGSAHSSSSLPSFTGNLYASATSAPSDIKVDPTLVQPPMSCDRSLGSSSCFQRYKDNPSLLLPAYRWWSDTTINQNVGVGDVLGTIGPIMNLLSTIFFTLASWCWFILLNLVSFAMNLDLVFRFATEINSAFLNLTNIIFSPSTPIIPILIAIGAFFMVRFILKGRLFKAAGVILVVVLPVATLAALADMTNNNPGVTPKGSPAWIAEQGSGYVDSIAGTLSTGFGMSGVAGGSAQVASSTASNSPSCGTYLAALYDQYYAFSGSAVQLGSVQPDTDPRVWNNQMENGQKGLTAIQSGSHVGLTTVSYLWQRAYLSTWETAQYGSEENGANLYCHQLDFENGASIGEQYSLLLLSGLYHQAKDANGNWAQDPVDYTFISPKVFDHPGFSGVSSQDQETADAYLWSWAACSESGDTSKKMVAVPGWVFFDNLTVGTQTSDDANQACDLFFKGQSDAKSSAITAGENGIQDVVGWASLLTPEGFLGAGNGVLGGIGNWLSNQAAPYTGQALLNGAPNFISFQDQSALGGAYDSGAQTIATFPPDQQGKALQQFNNANDTVLNFWGHNSGPSFLAGALALVTAIIYLYALGALALGTAMAQIGLVLMLMLLPATLLLMAIPAKDGGRLRSGSTLLKLTLGFLVSKLMLSVVLLLLLQAIVLFETIIGGGSGAASQVLHALIPLVCLFLIKKLLAIAGMGDLTSLSGAMGMPLSAALSVTGDKGFKSSVMGGFQRGADKLGLNKADLAAKKAGKWAAKKPLDAAKWGGKKGAEVTGLDLMKKNLIGGKDALGNKEYGLLHQLTSLAGLIDAANESDRLLARPAKKFLGTDTGKKLAKFADDDRVRAVGNPAEIAKDQRRARKELLDATRGMTRREANEARRNYARKNANLLHAQQNALRDDDGRLLRDSAGNMIFGYEAGRATPLTNSAGKAIRLDKNGRVHIGGKSGPEVYGFTNADGETIDYEAYKRLSPKQKAAYKADTEPIKRILSQEEYAALAPSERASARAITDVMHPGVLDPVSINQRNQSYMSAHQLRKGQGLVSLMGYAPLPRPVMGDADGRNRYTKSRSLDQTLELMKNGMAYLAPEIKALGMSLPEEEQQAIFFHNVLREVGAIDDQGRFRDVPKMYGVDLDILEGKQQGELANEGTPSALDKIVLTASDSVIRAHYAQARDSGRLGAESGKWDAVNKARAELRAQIVTDSIDVHGRVTNAHSQAAGAATVTRSGVSKMETAERNYRAAAAAAPEAIFIAEQEAADAATRAAAYVPGYTAVTEQVAHVEQQQAPRVAAAAAATQTVGQARSRVQAAEAARTNISAAASPATQAAIAAAEAALAQSKADLEAAEAAAKAEEDALAELEKTKNELETKQREIEEAREKEEAAAKAAAEKAEDIRRGVEQAQIEAERSRKALEGEVTKILEAGQIIAEQGKKEIENYMALATEADYGYVAKGKTAPNSGEKTADGVAKWFNTQNKILQSEFESAIADLKLRESRLLEILNDQDMTSADYNKAAEEITKSMNKIVGDLTRKFEKGNSFERAATAAAAEEAVSAAAAKLPKDSPIRIKFGSDSK